jgi:O-antigen ligase
MAAAGLGVMLAAGWLDGLAILAVCLPLPGLVLDDARLHPAAVVTGLVVLAWVVRTAPRRRASGGAGLPRVPLAALILAVGIAAVFARDRVAAARELADWGALLALLVVATDTLARSGGARRSLALLLAGVAGVAGFAAVLETLGILPAPFPLRGTALNRATLGFGWPNELGMFFAILLPLCAFARRAAAGSAGRALGTAAVVGCVVGLACTFSRASWLAALAAPAVLFLVGGGRSAARIWLAGAVGIVALDLATGGVLFARAASLAGDAFVEQRAALMLVGLLMFRDHPWVGVGPGGFATHLEEYGPQVTWLWDYVGSAHNAYVEIAAELGILGLAAFLTFLAAVLLRLLRQVKRAAEDPGTPAETRHLTRAVLWSFATFCTVAVTAWPFAHGLGELVMLVVALGLALRLVPEPAP